MNEQVTDREEKPSEHRLCGAFDEEPGVVFLGDELTADEYRGVCSALKEFFDILHDWQTEQSNAK